MVSKVSSRAGESQTTNYGWVKPTVGASVDAWGGYINTDLDSIDSTVKSVSNAIPGPSLTTPAMDGTAAIGTNAAYARADHVHPSDTSRYAATNPSGYQTAAQVTASLGSYLLLAGGTLTGALTPSQTAGIVGATTNNNAAAGAVGEHVSADQMANVALVNNTNKNITSISLTAGDWDVEGNAYFAFSVGGTLAAAAISAVSASLPTTTLLGTTQLQNTTATLVGPSLATGAARMSLAATTNVYLVGIATFSSGACNAQGSIRARRVR